MGSEPLTLLFGSVVIVVVLVGFVAVMYEPSGGVSQREIDRFKDDLIGWIGSFLVFVALSGLVIWALDSSDSPMPSTNYDDYEYEAMQQDAIEDAYYQNVVRP
jgi:hypothetical protein